MKKFKEILFEMMATDVDIAKKFKVWANTNYSADYDAGRNKSGDILIRMKTGLIGKEKWTVIAIVKNGKLVQKIKDVNISEMINRFNKQHKY